MYFIALATDYDGTLAEDGTVAAATLQALDDLRQSGRRLILVTGRELPDLQRVCAALDRFDLVVAENGALLYEPASGTETALGAAPPRRFVEALRARGISPLSVGRSIVATWEPHETAVLDVVRELGLELQIIFNKGAVMVLPAGINKATGLAAALSRLKLSPLNVVAVGDAENDHAFLQASGCAVAVANALPPLKAGADLVTERARGAGIVELIGRLIADDLAPVSSHILRHRLELARDPQPADPDKAAVFLHAQTANVLIAGSSGAGKSTATTGLLERIAEGGWQFCVIDPEGDYAGLEAAVTVGDAKTPPRLPEIMELLEQPAQNVVVDLTGVELADRPRFLATFVPKLCELRARTSRPHWLVIDEAHHMLPLALGSAAVSLPREFVGVVMVTLEADRIAQPALQAVNSVLMLGKHADARMRSFFERAGVAPPPFGEAQLSRNEALFWDAAVQTVRRVQTIPPRGVHLRHTRKYAEGALTEDQSFYFRGPENRLQLRAQNLVIFLQIGAGVDDETWHYHLRSGDYSGWIRTMIKDAELADEVAAIETDSTLDAPASRARIKAAIEARYTAPG